LVAVSLPIQQTIRCVKQKETGPPRKVTPLFCQPQQKGTIRCI